MLTQESFGDCVKDALKNLFDVAHLQTHPLTRMLAQEDIQQNIASQRVREILIRSVEAIRPAESITDDSLEWLSYRVLVLTYLECLSISSVCDELGLGRTSYYKYRNKGLDAVVSILWQQHEGSIKSSIKNVTLGEEDVHAESARAEAIRIARASRCQPVDLDELLHSVEQIVAGVARQREITLAVHAPDALPVLYADPAMLRQAVLNILTDALQSTATDLLTFEVQSQNQDTLWKLGILNKSILVALNSSEETGLSVGRGLLEVYGGRLWIQACQESNFELCFTIPIRHQPALLIIDDDENTTALYHRYLGQWYSVWVASSARTAWEHLSTVTPDLVILDVLMPEQDGWDVLQRLKTMPETRVIPVLVCSVLSQPSLALTLGAAEVLQKPFDQETLLRSVRQIVNSPE
jgi:CheY-like chemotaxis protein